MEDFELLREYAEHRSERAFTQLVQRHIDFVYSTAVRLVTESQLAEDVTQLVFLKLGRKAASLHKEVILTGWLYRTTQFVARTVLRSDWRRRKRESLAMQFTELNAQSESVWKELAPLLEQAMTQLRQRDQDAVLLRFFAGKNLREVGSALGISDDAAQKRINRALEKMRDYFAARDIIIPVALIAPAIAAHAVQTAPSSLATNLAASLASAGSIGTTTFKILAIAKLKSAAGGLLVTGLVLFSGALVAVRMMPQDSSPQTGAGLSSENRALVLRGQVRTSDGKPVAGALVRVATPQTYVRLYQTTNPSPRLFTNLLSAASNRVMKAATEAPSTNTAADGRFVISLSELPKEDLAAVVVNSDLGYALVTAPELSVNPDIIVEPWARIEGVLRIGKSLASNQTVNIGIWGATALYDWNLVQHGASTKTDGEGRFVFPRVAPVDVWLTRTVMVRTNEGRQSDHHYLKLFPGAQLQVQLGGEGRALTGHVPLNRTNNLVYSGSMWASQVPGMRHPANWKSMSREEQRRYERAWRDSPAGELFKQSVRNYEFPVQSDGTFRVEDVQAGSYRMQLRGDEPIPGGKGMRRAAEAEILVEVPEVLNGASAEPIDLGVVVLAPAANR